MEEERIYRLKNGKEMILLTTINYNGIRHLLLTDERTNDIEVAYEENEKLVFINKQNPYFSDILLMLFKKYKKIMDEQNLTQE